MGLINWKCLCNDNIAEAVTHCKTQFYSFFVVFKIVLLTNFGYDIGQNPIQPCSCFLSAARLVPLKDLFPFMELVFLEMDVKSMNLPDSGLSQHRTGGLESSYCELRFVFHECNV